jgi:hypothetical protein
MSADELLATVAVWVAERHLRKHPETHRFTDAELAEVLSRAES